LSRPPLPGGSARDGQRRERVVGARHLRKVLEAWRFDGAAARTVEFLAGLYEGGMKDIVEPTLERIRTGQVGN